jgi:hypothetical protein
MIQKLVDLIFKWDSLRKAIFAEVDWHNSITRIMEDPEDMKIATAMWCESDGWRGWTIDDGKYYFNDIPEKSLSDLMEIFDGRSESDSQ